MTPKEKAKELVDKFRLHVLEKDFFGDSVEHDNAKQCALIAVDEMLNNGNLESQLIQAKYRGKEPYSFELEYWQEVKQEIEKL
mgnify:CR=1 FL=1